MRLALALLVMAALVWSAVVHGAGGEDIRTLRVDLESDVDYVDPALSYSAAGWALEYATALKLFNHPDQPGRAGVRIVPEAASGFPRVSADGRTWTFEIRRGLSFSNGEPVTARSFERAFVRALHPKMASPAQEFLRDIVGGPAFTDGRSRTVRGVQALGRYRLRIRLTTPAPNLPARLAMPFFAAVPVRLAIDPDGARVPLPSAGPYYVAEWRLKERIVLRRNRFYRGSRAQRPSVNSIVFQIVPSLSQQQVRVERGDTDFATLPQSSADDLAGRYGVNLARLHVRRDGRVRFLLLNRFSPLFRGRSPLRTAVALALNRAELAAGYGPYAGYATDRLLPPSSAAFREAAFYPLRDPDAWRARDLARGRTRDGRLFVWGSLPPAAAESLRRSLASIGLTLTPASCSRHGGATRVDAVLGTWGRAHADPLAAILGPLESGPFCAKGESVPFEAVIRHDLIRMIQTVDASARRGAAIRELEAQLVRPPPVIVPFMETTSRILLSARVRCFVHHPLYGADYAAACLNVK